MPFQAKVKPIADNRGWCKQGHVTYKISAPATNDAVKHHSRWENMDVK